MSKDFGNRKIVILAILGDLFEGHNHVFIYLRLSVILAILKEKSSIHEIFYNLIKLLMNILKTNTYYKDENELIFFLHF